MIRATRAQSLKVGHGDPSSLLLSLPLVPLVLTALLLGKALRPFMAEVLGLSPSLLRGGRSLNLRESREQTAIASANVWFRKRAAENDWNEGEITALQKTAPSILASESRPYADFIYGLQFPGRSELPLTIAFAEKVDRLLNRLVAAYQSDDLEAFKQGLSESDWIDEFPRTITDRQITSRRKNALCAARNWVVAMSPANEFLADLMVCLLASMDAEHGSTYFAKFRPRPLFLLVAPKINAKSLDKLPRRNPVRRPVRRLLELSHALMVWARDRRWPKKPVGRKELGEALNLEDYVVGNLFDGTKNMNAENFNTYWVSLCRTVARRKPWALPLPLLLAAIYSQNVLIRQHPNQKLKSVASLDGANYTRIWTWHRRRWANHLSHGTEGWPEWLGD